MCVLICMRVSVCHVYTGALSGKLTVSDSLELGLLELVNNLIQVVGPLQEQQVLITTEQCLQPPEQGLKPSYSKC